MSKEFYLEWANRLIYEIKGTYPTERQKEYIANYLEEDIKEGIIDIVCGDCDYQRMYER